MGGGGLKVKIINHVIPCALTKMSEPIHLSNFFANIVNNLKSLFNKSILCHSSYNFVLFCFTLTKKIIFCTTIDLMYRFRR